MRTDVCREETCTTATLSLAVRPRKLSFSFKRLTCSRRVRPEIFTQREAKKCTRPAEMFGVQLSRHCGAAVLLCCAKPKRPSSKWASRQPVGDTQPGTTLPRCLIPPHFRHEQRTTQLHLDCCLFSVSVSPQSTAAKEGGLVSSLPLTQSIAPRTLLNVRIPTPLIYVN